MTRCRASTIVGNPFGTAGALFRSRPQRAVSASPRMSRRSTAGRHERDEHLQQSAHVPPSTSRVTVEWKSRPISSAVVLARSPVATRCASRTKASTRSHPPSSFATILTVSHRPLPRHHWLQLTRALWNHYRASRRPINHIIFNGHLLSSWQSRHVRINRKTST